MGEAVSEMQTGARRHFDQRSVFTPAIDKHPAAFPLEGPFLDPGHSAHESQILRIGLDQQARIHERARAAVSTELRSTHHRERPSRFIAQGALPEIDRPSAPLRYPAVLQIAPEVLFVHSRKHQAPIHGDIKNAICSGDQLNFDFLAKLLFQIIPQTGGAGLEVSCLTVFDGYFHTIPHSVL